MPLVKQIFLGSAACLVTLSTVSAADFPSKTTPAIEYVRVCSEYGKGYFYIPGSDTCIQIGGRVRADTGFSESTYRGADSFQFGAQARLNIDARTNTPYGTVRTYLRYALTRTQSNWNTSGNYVTKTGGSGDGGGLDLAYIQFAGLTAGRVNSFFDFYVDTNTFAAIRNSYTKNLALAYTFNFGSGFSLTGAIEDGTERRLFNQWKNTRIDGSVVTDVTFADGKFSGYTSAGQTVPDAIAVLEYDGKWGSAHLSTALHQIRPAFGGLNSEDRDATYGFAVKGGVKLNLPMIASGDALWFEASYAEGALDYIGAGKYGFNPVINVPIADAYVGENGQIKKVPGWSTMAVFQHYWTSSIRQNIFASYMKIEYDHNAYGIGAIKQTGEQFYYGFVPTSEWRVGTNVIWSPIKNFDIGVEAVYTRTDPKGRVLSYNNTASPKTISYADHWQGRLRVQRDF